MRRLLLCLCAFLTGMTLFAQGQKDADVRIYTDTLVSHHILGGYVKEGRLQLFGKPSYRDLPDSVKTLIVNAFQSRYGDKGIMVNLDNTDEYWIAGKDSRYYLLDRWTAGQPALEQYLPIPVETTAGGRLFWYVGGQMNGSKGLFSMSASGRVGTFLYKDRLDASVLASLVLSRANGETSFSSEIGTMGRWFFSIQGTRIRPYGGAGVTLLISSGASLELVLYTGASYPLGAGSLDLGFQYGTVSSYRFTLGYTFFPKFLNQTR